MVGQPPVTIVGMYGSTYTQGLTMGNFSDIKDKTANDTSDSENPKNVVQITFLRPNLSVHGPMKRLRIAGMIEFNRLVVIRILATCG